MFSRVGGDDSSTTTSFTRKMNPNETLTKFGLTKDGGSLVKPWPGGIMLDHGLLTKRGDRVPRLLDIRLESEPGLMIESTKTMQNDHSLSEDEGIFHDAREHVSSDMTLSDDDEHAFDPIEDPSRARERSHESFVSSVVSVEEGFIELGQDIEELTPSAMDTSSDSDEEALPPPEWCLRVFPARMSDKPFAKSYVDDPRSCEKVAKEWATADGGRNLKGLYEQLRTVGYAVVPGMFDFSDPWAMMDPGHGSALEYSQIFQAIDGEREGLGDGLRSQAQIFDHTQCWALSTKRCVVF